jgi:hypothetical protein
MLPNFTDKERGVANREVNNRANLPAERMVKIEQVRALDARDQAIVDEAFLRGASVEEVMEILAKRALPPKTDIGEPSFLRDPGMSRGYSADSRLELPGMGPDGSSLFLQIPERATERVLRNYAESQVARTRMEAEGYLAIARSRVDQVEALRPIVVARYQAYLAHTKSEFDALSPFVQASFAPIRTEPCPDPFSVATAEDKYRVLRGAYYRAGYTSIKRDILDHIVPTTFFRIAVSGGTYLELRELLIDVENEVRRINPGLGNQVAAGGFRIGGFVPRFQCGSNQLSNHAFGLAIDIDWDWNSQIKTKSKRVIDAFERATGEKVNVLFRNSSSFNDIRQTYERAAAFSGKLQAWLRKWMPKYEQLQTDRIKYKNDPTAKQKLSMIENEIITNPDLAALNTLINEYKKPTVQAWQAYGIITIPPEIIESFVKLGQKNGARWGGEYAESKDFMHLELLRIASPTSPARPHGPGRRPPVNGLEDLVRGEGYPAPNYGSRK